MGRTAAHNAVVHATDGLSTTGVGEGAAITRYLRVSKPGPCSHFTVNGQLCKMVDRSSDDVTSTDAWLPESFAALVEASRSRWVALPEAASFLLRGAARAVEIIHDSVGPVGPPVRPEAGALFIVDERRLPTWREDGFRYRAVPADFRHRAAAGILYSDGSVYGSRSGASGASGLGSGGGVESASGLGSSRLRGAAASGGTTDMVTVTFLQPIAAASVPATPRSAAAFSASLLGSGDFAEQTLVLEWSAVDAEADAAAGGAEPLPPRHLQRRALRLPRIGSAAPATPGGVALLTASGLGVGRGVGGQGYIWLVQYLEDPVAPRYTPNGQPAAQAPHFLATLPTVAAPTVPAGGVGPVASPLLLPQPLPALPQSAQTLPVSSPPQLSTAASGPEVVASATTAPRSDLEAEISRALADIESDMLLQGPLGRPAAEVAATASPSPPRQQKKFPGPSSPARPYALHSQFSHAGAEAINDGEIIAALYGGVPSPTPSLVQRIPPVAPHADTDTASTTASAESLSLRRSSFASPQAQWVTNGKGDLVPFVAARTELEQLAEPERRRRHAAAALQAQRVALAHQLELAQDAAALAPDREAEPPADDSPRVVLASALVGAGDAQKSLPQFEAAASSTRPPPRSPYVRDVAGLEAAASRAASLTMQAAAAASASATAAAAAASVRANAAVAAGDCASQSDAAFAGAVATVEAGLAAEAAEAEPQRRRAGAAAVSEPDGEDNEHDKRYAAFSIPEVAESRSSYAAIHAEELAEQRRRRSLDEDAQGRRDGRRAQRFSLGASHGLELYDVRTRISAGDGGDGPRSSASVADVYRFGHRVPHGHEDGLDDGYEDEDWGEASDGFAAQVREPLHRSGHPARRPRGGRGVDDAGQVARGDGGRHRTRTHRGDDTDGDDETGVPPRARSQQASREHRRTSDMTSSSLTGTRRRESDAARAASTAAAPRLPAQQPVSLPGLPFGALPLGFNLGSGLGLAQVSVGGRSMVVSPQMQLALAMHQHQLQAQQQLLHAQQEQQAQQRFWQQQAQEAANQRHQASQLSALQREAQAILEQAQQARLRADGSQHAPAPPHSQLPPRPHASAYGAPLYGGSALGFGGVTGYNPAFDLGRFQQLPSPQPQLPHLQPQPPLSQAPQSQPPQWQQPKQHPSAVPGEPEGTDTAGPYGPRLVDPEHSPSAPPSVPLSVPFHRLAPTPAKSEDTELPAALAAAASPPIPAHARRQAEALVGPQLVAEVQGALSPAIVQGNACVAPDALTLRAAPICSGRVAEVLRAAVIGWRVRAVLRLKKVGVMRQRARDTRKLLRDLRDASAQDAAAAGCEGDGAAFQRSIAAQLQSEVGELRRIFVDSDGQRAADELSAFLRAQLRLLKGKQPTCPLVPSSGGGLGDSADAVPDPNDAVTAARGAKRAAERKQRLVGGALGKSVMAKYSLVRTATGEGAVGVAADENQAADTAGSGTGGAQGVNKAVAEKSSKPWMKERVAAPNSGAGSEDTVVVAPAPRQRRNPLLSPSGASSSGSGSGPNTAAPGAPAAVARDEDDASFGLALEPSGKWRVLVEIIGAKALAPALYAPGTLAAGPGLKASGSATALLESGADPASLAPDPEARESFAVAYLARHLAAPTAGAAGDSAAPASKQVKVLGKKMQTGVAAKTLSPQWRRRFLFSLPARAGLDGASVAEGAPLPLEPEALLGLAAARPHLAGWELRLEVLDSDRYVRDTFMGGVVLSLDALLAGTQAAEAAGLAAIDAPLCTRTLSAWMPLQSFAGGDRVKGQLQLRARLLAPLPSLRLRLLQAEASVESEGGGAGGGASGPAPPTDGTAVGASAFLRRKSVNPKPRKVDWSGVPKKTFSGSQQADGASAPSSGRTLATVAAAAVAPSQSQGHAVRMFRMPDFRGVRGKVAVRAGLEPPSSGKVRLSMDSAALALSGAVGGGKNGPRGFTRTGVVDAHELIQLSGSARPRAASRRLL